MLLKEKETKMSNIENWKKFEFNKNGKYGFFIVFYKKKKHKDFIMI